MIVAQSEISAIHYRRRRQLHLPVERGEFGELRPCPLEVGELRKLQTARGQKSTAITVVGVELAQRQEGPAWRVTFALGDRTEFYDKHRERYLSRKGAGTTTDLERALKTEPAVTSEEELKLATRAREKRELEDEQHWRLQKRAIEGAIAELRARNGQALASDLHFLERRLAKMERMRRGIRPTVDEQSRVAVP